MTDKNQIEYSPDIVKMVLLEKHFSELKNVEYISEEDQIIFSEVIFSRPVILDYAPQFKSVHFFHCTFLDQFECVGTFENDFSFAYCIFENTCRFVIGKYKAIDFKHCRFSIILSFYEASFEYITLSSVYHAEIIVSLCKIDWFTLYNHDNPEDHVVKSIQIADSDIKKLFFTRLICYEVKLSGDIEKDGKYVINQLSCTNFKLERISNQGVFKLTGIRNIKTPEIKLESIFSLINCNLNKAEFYNIDLKAFRNVHMSESIVADCLFANIKWPDKFNVGEGNENENRIDNYRDKREIYRQLKFALSKQGNSYDEQYFHTKELNALFHSLPFYSHFWTKLVIGLSWMSSNYGVSILRPIIFLAVINWFLFRLIYHIDTSQINMITDAFKSENDSYILGAFVHYLNPIHKLDENFKGYQIIVDSLMRIVSSYSIYNFIRASRRFIK